MDIRSTAVAADIAQASWGDEVNDSGLLGLIQMLASNSVEGVAAGIAAAANDNELPKPVRRSRRTRRPDGRPPTLVIDFGEDDSLVPSNCDSDG